MFLALRLYKHTPFKSNADDCNKYHALNTVSGWYCYQNIDEKRFGFVFVLQQITDALLFIRSVHWRCGCMSVVSIHFEWNLENIWSFPKTNYEEFARIKFR